MAEQLATDEWAMEGIKGIVSQLAGWRQRAKERAGSDKALLELLSKNKQTKQKKAHTHTHKAKNAQKNARHLAPSCLNCLSLDKLPSHHRREDEKSSSEDEDG